MKLNKNREAEVLKAYELYFDSYIAGDVTTIAAMLDDNYNQIGSAESEVFFNKHDALKFLHETIDQVAGKTEIRNRELKAEALKEYFLVTDLFDIYVQIEDEWSFYSKFRASTLMEKIAGQWIFVHQHSSVPDLKAQEGENIAIEKVSAENQQLREAVKRRTVELENKNRELQIEASLERVRARTMAMQKSEELSEVSALLFKELINFCKEITGSGIVLCDRDIPEQWMCSGDLSMLPPIHIPKDFDPTIKNMYKAWEMRQELFYETITGEECKQHFESMMSLPEIKNIFKNVPQESIKRPLSQTNYAATFKHGYLLVMTENPISSAWIFPRFAKLFEQTYTRFLDLQKAEANAREARIEAALEKVRSGSLAMHNSNQIRDIVKVVFEKLKELKFAIDGGVFVGTIPKNSDYVNFWIGDDHAEYPGSFKIPHYDAPTITDVWNAQKSGVEFFSKTYPFKEKNIWFEYAFKHTDLKTALPEDFKKWILEQEYLTQSFAMQKNSMIGVHFHHARALTENEIDILKRFSRVFEQSYVRFLDLQKAEAQAREAQIEAALERVRSRSMAMHQSTELNDVAFVLFDQLRSLGGRLWGTGFVLCEHDSEVDIVWFANEKGILPPVAIPHTKDPVHRNMYKSWEGKVEFLAESKGGKKLKIHYDYMLSLPDVKPFFQNILDQGLTFPDWQQWNGAFFSHGYLLVITQEPYKDELILKRFAKVFEQTYTRFLDLQKAEAQAREAQIEAALERVRSRSMAMHSSDELLKVIRVVSKQLLELGVRFDHVSFAVNNEQSDFRFWSSIVGYNEPVQLDVPFLDNPMYRRLMKARKKGADFFTDTLTPEESREYLEHMFKHVDLGFVDKKKKEAIFNGAFARSVAILPQIMLILANYAGKVYSEEENNLIRRFAKVFEQAYTRFLDLQKAESQAREAQVEAALERVRSRTMGMQKSEELADLSLELVKQVQELGKTTWFCAFNIYDDDAQGSMEWGSNGEGTFPKYRTPREGVFLRYYNAGQQGETLLINEIGPDECPAHYDYLCSLPGVGDQLLKMKAAGIPFPSSQIDHVAYFKYGYILFITYEAVPELHDIFIRFAKVFEQSYTRFLDLQKAEAQAREAEIELALERVRARSMAMQTSEELKDVIKEIFDQMTLLNINAEHAGIVVNYEPKQDWHFWVAENQDIPAKITVPYLDLVWDKQFTEAKKKGKNFFTTKLNFTEKNSFYRELLPHISGLTKKSRDFYLSCPGLAISTVIQKDIGLYIENFSGNPYSDKENDTIMRFGKVFQQTYTRFLDLQKAESAGKEAIRQASLDRVRAEIASMRTTKDLERITPIIWRELRTLKVPFFRCGVFIMNDQTKTAKVYLSDQAGNSLASWESAYDKVPLISASAKHWRAQKIFREEWDKKQFMSLTKSLLDQKLIDDPKHFQAGETAPEHLVLQLVPFRQGMLYVGSDTHLDDDQIKLAQSLAKAFSIAYARYEDFNELENAKTKVEVTLSELKSTQTQLIQAEKMASLGELTAGIAHEIQNPLNFVNNFAEVSEELLLELIEELDNGDLEEAKLISDDVIQNLKKIHHHGQRAGDIVKGMLQHSRAGSGKKEMTDINKLADEYLRLAYHGLRAKDKSFNADFKTDFDETLPEINVVPQDMGRVLLNLINNAFYAASSAADANFKPEVIVRTKRNGKTMEICVQDNGNGIPKEAMDKIFQPFFTTKPTGQGTGLGLSLSYDIVTKGHNGHLEAETEEGVGTRFIVRLPIV